MLRETRTIIESALLLDSTLTDNDRRRIRDFIQTGTKEVRRRITASHARGILGLSESTWLRRINKDERYRALTVVLEGKRAFYFLDEIEAVRDGKQGGDTK